MSCARKCDRCGKLYNEYKRPENDGKCNAIMITNLDEDRKYWKQPLLDLCPECMDEFEKWMKVGGTT